MHACYVRKSNIGYIEFATINVQEERRPRYPALPSLVLRRVEPPIQPARHPLLCVSAMSQP